MNRQHWSHTIHRILRNYYYTLYAFVNWISKNRWNYGIFSDEIFVLDEIILSSNRSSVVVSTARFQAEGPGSIPGRDISKTLKKIV